MWHLHKIPRILHVYFGGDKVSYLRYMTVKTFVNLNRDWQVRFYYPRFPQPLKSWVSFEQKYLFEGEDYFEQLKKLPIKMIPFDFTTIGVDNSLSEVYKSDYLRWYLLSTVGGLWSDMDILYFKPMNSLPFNTPDNVHIDTGVCICRYGHSIGFMLASKENLYYSYVWKRTKQAWNASNYQSIGSILSNRLFPTVAAIQRVLPQLNPVNIPMDVVYAYDAARIHDIYKSTNLGRFTNHSIGLHWYAGHPLAGQYLQETKGGVNAIPDCVLGKTLTALTSISLPSYVNRLVGGSKHARVLDLGCGDKTLATLIQGTVTTVDLWEKFKPDVVWDLNQTPLPFGDDSFDMILMIDVIEHLEKERGMELLREAKRITKGTILLLTPLWWTDNLDCMSDKDSPYYENPYERHKSLWAKEDFKGWTEVTELGFIRNYYIGVWEKQKKMKVTIESYGRMGE
jgi:SAM-dependent methyltransferase